MKLPPNLYFHATQIANILGISEIKSELNKLRNEYHFKSFDEMLLLIENVDHLVHDLKLDIKETKYENNSDLISKFNPALKKLKESSEASKVKLATDTENFIHNLMDSKVTTSEYHTLISQFKSAIGQLNPPITIDETVFSEVHQLFELIQLKSAITALNLSLGKRIQHDNRSETSLLYVEISELLKEKCFALLEKEYKQFDVTYSLPYNKLINFITLLFNREVLDRFFTEFTSTQIEKIKNGMINFIQLHLVTLDIMCLKARASKENDIVEEDCNILIGILNDEKNYLGNPINLFEFLGSAIKKLAPQTWKTSEGQYEITCQKITSTLRKYINKNIITSPQIFNLVAFYDKQSENLFNLEYSRLLTAKGLIEGYLKNSFNVIIPADSKHFISVIDTLKLNRDLFETLNNKTNEKNESYNALLPFIGRLKSLPSLPSTSRPSITGKESLADQTGYYNILKSVKREFEEENDPESQKQHIAQGFAKSIVLGAVTLRSTKISAPAPSSSTNLQNSTPPSLPLNTALGQIKLKKTTPLPSPNKEENKENPTAPLSAMQAAKLREKQLIEQTKKEEEKKQSFQKTRKSVIVTNPALFSTSTLSSTTSAPSIISDNKPSDLVAASFLTNPTSTSQESSSSSSSSSSSTSTSTLSSS